MTEQRAKPKGRTNREKVLDGYRRENTVYGRQDASDEDVLRAAQLAEAHNSIGAMPDGRASLVGERGIKLSAGQRQRPMIARAIVRDPAVLILDEAASAIDNETEAAIERSLAKVSEGRATIVVSHRLSTIRPAHRLHVMDAGRVIESGTDDELVAAGGLYAPFWRVQTCEAAE